MIRERAVSLGTVLAVLPVAAVFFAACTVESPEGETNGTAGTTATGTAGSGGGTPTSTAGSTGTVTAGSTGIGTAGSGGGQAPVAGASTSGGQSSTAGSAGAGTAGTGAGGQSGGRPSGPSAGCTKAPPNETPGSQVLHTIDVTGMADKYVAGYTHRKYCTQMPKDYDPTKPYPVVFYGPGCGATSCEGSNFSGRSDVFIVQAIAGADAKGDNLVPKNGAPGCFQAGKEGTGDSPEGPYFDQVMAQVDGAYCIDRGKVYAAGTSSGSWLSNYLACARGNVIRGIAADSGGLQYDHGTCQPGAAIMELPGDAATAKDQAGHEIGSALARDMFVMLNGCSMTPTTMSYGPANNCQVYGGCASPVAWCNVGGGHQSGNGLIAAAAMAFWGTLQ
jgi:polyhydroxybutyrate depolymerase